MRQFSRLVEKLESNKFFKVQTNLDLLIKAEDSGEAAYLAERILENKQDQHSFQILKVEEISKNEFNELVANEKVSLLGERILNSWSKFFGEKTPTLLEKMEFYHLMRSRGFDSSTIESALESKL
jgi:SOS response regulatory protein OraA/RecX